MRHWVQYHNAAVRGPYRYSRKEFGIVTNKPVEKLRNDRVWLIGGEGGSRKQYFLYETFVVENVEEVEGPQRNLARSSQGVAFKRPPRIDGFPWFNRLRKAAGNFAFGLQRIKNEDVIRGLEAGSSSDPDKVLARAPRAAGAGFGSAEENRRVEKAAINAVIREYKSRGWRVKSMERFDLGYDLHCTRAKDEEHVEVKGVRGSLCSFIVTSNEADAAKADPRFRLCVVTNALRASHRKISRFPGRALGTVFALQPISFVAKPR